MLTLWCWPCTLCILASAVPLNQVIASSCMFQGSPTLVSHSAGYSLGIKIVNQRSIASIKLNYGDCIDNILQTEKHKDFFHQTFCLEYEWNFHEDFSTHVSGLPLSSKKTLERELHRPRLRGCRYSSCLQVQWSETASSQGIAYFALWWENTLQSFIAASNGILKGNFKTMHGKGYISNSTKLLGVAFWSHMWKLFEMFSFEGSFNCLSSFCKAIPGSMPLAVIWYL